MPLCDRFKKWTDNESVCCPLANEVYKKTQRQTERFCCGQHGEACRVCRPRSWVPTSTSSALLTSNKQAEHLFKSFILEVKVIISVTISIDASLTS